METEQKSPKGPLFGKRISQYSILIIGVGTIIGGAIFSTIGTISKFAGPYVYLIFIIGGLIMMSSAYSNMKLISKWGGPGGEYIIINQAFQQNKFRHLGPLVGLLLYFGNIFIISILAYTFFIYLSFTFRFQPKYEYLVIYASIFLILGVLFNLKGFRNSEVSRKILLFLKLTVIIFIIVLGSIYIETNLDPELFQQRTQIEVLRLLYTPQQIFGENVFGVYDCAFAISLTMLLYQGSQAIGYEFKRMKDKKKGLRMILVSTISSLVIYTILSFIIISIVGPIALRTDEYTASLSMGVLIETMGGDIFNSDLGGQVLIWILFFLVCTFTFNSMNTTISETARSSFMLSKEKLFPEILSHKNEEKLPTNSTILTGVLSGLFLLLLPHVEDLIFVANILYAQIFIIINLTAYKKRKELKANRYISIFGVISISILLFILVFRMFTGLDQYLGVFLVSLSIEIMIFVFIYHREQIVRREDLIQERKLELRKKEIELLELHLMDLKDRMEKIEDKKDFSRAKRKLLKKLREFEELEREVEEEIELESEEDKIIREGSLIGEGSFKSSETTSWENKISEIRQNEKGETPYISIDVYKADQSKSGKKKYFENPYESLDESNVVIDSQKEKSIPSSISSLEKIEVEKVQDLPKDEKKQSKEKQEQKISKDLIPRPSVKPPLKVPEESSNDGGLKDYRENANVKKQSFENIKNKKKIQLQEDKKLSKSIKNNIINGGRSPKVDIEELNKNLISPKNKAKNKLKLIEQLEEIEEKEQKNQNAYHKLMSRIKNKEKGGIDLENNEERSKKEQELKEKALQLKKEKIKILDKIRELELKELEKQQGEGVESENKERIEELDKDKEDIENQITQLEQEIDQIRSDKVKPARSAQTKEDLVPGEVPASQKEKNGAKEGHKLKGKVEELEEKVKEIEKKSGENGNGNGTQEEELEGKVQELEAKVKKIESETEPPEEELLPPENGLEDKVQELEQKLQKFEKGEPITETISKEKELENKIGKLERKLRKLEADESNKDNQRKEEELESKILLLEKKLKKLEADELKEQERVKESNLEAKIRTLENKLQQMESLDLDSNKSSREKELEEKIFQLEDKLNNLELKKQNNGDETELSRKLKKRLDQIEAQKHALEELEIEKKSNILEERKKLVDRKHELERRANELLQVELDLKEKQIIQKEEEIKNKEKIRAEKLKEEGIPEEVEKGKDWDEAEKIKLKDEEESDEKSEEESQNPEEDQEIKENESAAEQKQESQDQNAETEKEKEEYEFQPKINLVEKAREEPMEKTFEDSSENESGNEEKSEQKTNSDSEEKPEGKEQTEEDGENPTEENS